MNYNKEYKGLVMIIEHANITVKSIEQSIWFLKVIYPELKILNSGSRDSEYGKHTWTHVLIEKSYFALEEVEHFDDIIKPMNSYHGVNHMGLIVNNIHTVANRLDKAKLHYHWAEYFPERKRLYAYDEYGMEFELIEYSSDSVEERFTYYSPEECEASIQHLK